VITGSGLPVDLHISSRVSPSATSVHPDSGSSSVIVGVTTAIIRERIRVITIVYEDAGQIGNLAANLAVN